MKKLYFAVADLRLDLTEATEVLGEEGARGPPRTTVGSRRFPGGRIALREAGGRTEVVRLEGPSGRLRS